jgi:hypothetical protein
MWMEKQNLGSLEYQEQEVPRMFARMANLDVPVDVQASAVVQVQVDKAPAEDAPYNSRTSTEKDIFFGLGLSAIVVSGMLLIRLISQPPAIFCNATEFAAGIVCAAGAIVFLMASLRYLPLSLLLVVIAAAHIFTHMRGPDLQWFGSFSTVLIAFTAILCLMKSKIKLSPK